MSKKEKKPSTIRRLASCIGEYKVPTILTPVFMIGEVGLEVLMPFITADLISEIQHGCGLDVIVKYGIILFVMALLSLGCGAAGGYTASKASAGFAKNLRYKIFDKVQMFSFESIDKFSSSSLVTRMTTDINNVQMSFMMIIRSAIRSPMMFIFAILMAFLKGGKLAFTFVIVIPVLVFGLILIAKKAMPAFHAVFKKYDKMNEAIEENVTAMRTVKGFVREDYEKNKFENAADSIRREFTKAERIVAFNNPLMNICLYFNMVFILAVGSKLIIGSQGTVLDVGALSALITYGVQVLMSLMMLSMIYVMITLSIESVRRIGEVLDEESTLRSPENAVEVIPDGSIDFEDVGFKYSAKAERFALSDIDLHIKSGETIGIIGGTGSSKSTLIQLIPRLYDATVGTVKVGGRDVREYDLKSLRDAVAVVLQKNVLFAGTIKENLRWGNENATDDEIVEACRLAQAEEFVLSFPEGYDRMIDQGGANVSGGQKQRLCIARALLKKPKILILDDSTSAVDTKTDALIRRGFETYIPDTTKIIIAQRIASVEHADRIIVMDNGTVTDVGTHDELLKTSRIYREVYEQQTKGGDDNA